jgi:hypothetical protein
VRREWSKGKGKGENRKTALRVIGRRKEMENQERVWVHLVSSAVWEREAFVWYLYRRGQRWQHLHLHLHLGLGVTWRVLTPRELTRDDSAALGLSGLEVCLIWNGPRGNLGWLGCNSYLICNWSYIASFFGACVIGGLAGEVYLTWQHNIQIVWIYLRPQPGFGTASPPTARRDLCFWYD